MRKICTSFFFLPGTLVTKANYFVIVYALDELMRAERDSNSNLRVRLQFNPVAKEGSEIFCLSSVAKLRTSLTLKLFASAVHMKFQ